MKAPDGADAAQLADWQRPDRGPAAALLGYRLRAVDIAAGTVEVTFLATARLFNPMGVMQGGLTMAMLELALTDAALILAGKDFATLPLELQCSFLAAVGPGPVLCRAHLLRRGRTTAFVDGQLYNAAGELAATGSAVIAPRGPGGTQP